MRVWDEVVGRSFRDVLISFPTATPIGIKHGKAGCLRLNPPDDYIVKAGGNSPDRKWQWQSPPSAQHTSPLRRLLASDGCSHQAPRACQTQTKMHRWKDSVLGDHTAQHCSHFELPQVNVAGHIVSDAPQLGCQDLSRIMGCFLYPTCLSAAMQTRILTRSSPGAHDRVLCHWQMQKPCIRKAPPGTAE